MKSMLRAVERLIWPRGLQCLCCGMNSGGALLCSECKEELDSLQLQRQEPDGCAVWRYAGCARTLVTELKLGCIGACAEVLAKEMAAFVLQMQLPEDVRLTWVTMTDKRRRERGIDHGRILCRLVAEKTGLPYEQLLIRTGKVHTQRGLSRTERLNNLDGTFRCSRRIQGTVLLIDDVITTGATARICTQALLKAGAARVMVLSATRVVLDDDKDMKG
ncbi:MAG: ComF family protein [Clostridia bacterium]|nr:ComF family protein [Clostridia bacterium]